MSDTIVAIATPLAQGAIGVIRLSGQEAVAIAEKVFVGKGAKILSKMAGYSAVYGEILSADGEVIDDVIALLYRAPRSYTGEEMVEFSCHGGVFVLQQVLRRLLQVGASLAEAGEFSKRAFLNGKLSLTKAESIMDLIGAKNQQALRCFRAQLQGALQKKIDVQKQMLLGLLARLSAWADYPEEDGTDAALDDLPARLEQLHQDFVALEKSFLTGQLLRDGIATAIVGKPNVGKSTLMNRLAGFEKSIITDIAGTTRDVVEQEIGFAGMMLKLADTAGIRTTDNLIEQVGISRALERIKTAQLILAVFDLSAPLDEEDTALLSRLSDDTVPVIAILNKSDLPHRLDVSLIEHRIQHIVYFNHAEEQGIESLGETIQELFSHTYHLNPGAAILLSERQQQHVLYAKQCVAQAAADLASGVTLDGVTIVLEQALEALLILSGERVTDAVVHAVFSKFCVGK